jgi:hypothetical protein
MREMEKVSMSKETIQYIDLFSINPNTVNYALSQLNKQI